MKTLPRYLASAAMAALLIGATAEVHAQTRPGPDATGWDAICQDTGAAATDYRTTLDRMTVRACDYQLRMKATAQPREHAAKTPWDNPKAVESGKAAMAVSLER